MNLKEYISIAKSKKWKGNPELARELYKYGLNIIIDAVKGKKVMNMSTEDFSLALATYWINQGLTNEEMTWLILERDTVREVLRQEFDEDYIELNSTKNKGRHLAI